MKTTCRISPIPILAMFQLAWFHHPMLKSEALWYDGFPWLESLIKSWSEQRTWYLCCITASRIVMIRGVVIDDCTPVFYMYIVLLLSIVILTSRNNITPIFTLSICYLRGCFMYLITTSELIRENNIRNTLQIQGTSVYAHLTITVTLAQCKLISHSNKNRMLVPEIQLPRY